MDSLQMQFLVAMPQLHNSYFERSVILLIEHSQQGAMGLVINKGPQISLDELFEQLDLPSPTKTQLTLSEGGPVEPQQGFVLHHNSHKDWKSTVSLSQQHSLCLSTSLDVVEAIAHDKGPQQALMALGYAGWDEGQLEQELQENAWLTLPFDMNILMRTAQKDMLDTLTEANNIDYNRLVTSMGHA